MEPKLKITKNFLVEHAETIEGIFRRAVREALLMHKRAGNPIAAWRDGKVVWIPPEEIVIPDDDSTDES